METDSLQKREIFHLAFLRALLRRVPGDTIALKGGTNLRFFFGSIRYSEDMDLDARKIAVQVLQDKVTTILRSRSLQDVLVTYGILEVIPPDLRYAKQTETVQRFKIHLRARGGEDLSTKVEFSRRGLDGEVRVEPVPPTVVGAYKMPPLLVPHYVAESAVRQKIKALASRAEPQARDVFDLYTLSSQPRARDSSVWKLREDLVREARERILAMSYGQYRDTVVAFLQLDDRRQYDSPSVWDHIRLTVISLFERGPES